MSELEEYEFESATEHIPSRTLLHGTDSTQKQVNIEKWVHQRIHEWATHQNKRMTQGVVSYECFLFAYDEMQDEFDQIEARLNKTLAQNGISVRAMNGLRWAKKSKIQKQMQDIADPHETKQRVRIWIPTKIQEQASWERKWGSRLGDAVVDLYSSVYTERLDRIEVKRELLNYLDSEIEPEHPVAQAVVELDDAQYDIPDRLQAGFNTDEYHIQSPDDYKTISDSLRTWDERHKAMRSLYNNVANIGINALTGLAVDSHRKVNKSKYARRRVREMEDKFEEVDFTSLEDEETGEQETLAERMDNAEKAGVTIPTMYQYADRVESREDKLDLVGLAVSNSEDDKILVDDIVYGLRKCELEVNEEDISDIPIVLGVGDDGVIHQK